MKDSNYRVCKNIFVTENKNQVALFNYNNKHWFKINKKAFELIKELAHLNYEEIDLKMKDSTDYNSEKFINFINFLKSNDYIEPIDFSDDNLAKQIMSQDDIQKAQKVIWLSITDRCNLKCSHCYNNTVYKEKINSNADVLLKIIDKLSDNNVKKVVLTGGEPFLHNGIFEILERALSIADSVEITTNGLLITNAICNKLKNYKNLRISVSVDGIKKDTHEFFRGKNTYEKVIKNIKCLVDAGIKTHSIATINRKNMTELANFSDFADKLGITSNFSLYTPVGTGSSVKDELMFNEEDYNKLANLFDERHKRKLENSNLNSSEDIDPSSLLLKKHCGAGLTTIGIEHTGRVVPCHLFLGKDITMGNILEEALKDIIFNWVNNEIVSVDEIEKCKTCSIKYFCGGGCMAHRYGATGSMAGVDPYCFMHKPHSEYLLWHSKN